VRAVRFVAVGDVMVDVLVSGRGHDATVRLVPGGSAVNAATTAAAASAAAEVVGMVGDDAAGRMVRAELAERGVRASLGVDLARPTGTFVLVDGEICVDRGANLGLHPDDLAASLDADAVLVSGHLGEEVVAGALERSRATWVALAPAILRELPGGGNALFLDEEEALALAGAGAEDAARSLGRRYRLVCVTRGPAGVVAVLDGAVERMEALPSVIGDRPGAGDAFAAATLVALARGMQLRSALADGCRAGALALTG